MQNRSQDVTAQVSMSISTPSDRKSESNTSFQKPRIKIAAQPIQFSTRPLSVPSINVGNMPASSSSAGHSQLAAPVLPCAKEMPRGAAPARKVQEISPEQM